MGRGPTVKGKGGRGGGRGKAQHDVKNQRDSICLHSFLPGIPGLQGVPEYTRFTGCARIYQVYRVYQDIPGLQGVPGIPGFQVVPG